MQERYELRAGKDAPCELWGVSKYAEICLFEGTHTSCMALKQRLENVAIQLG
jgi:hypothetical protein